MYHTRKAAIDITELFESAMGKQGTVLPSDLTDDVEAVIVNMLLDSGVPRKNIIDGMLVAPTTKRRS